MGKMTFVAKCTTSAGDIARRNQEKNQKLCQCWVWHSTNSDNAIDMAQRARRQKAYLDQNVQGQHPNANRTSDSSVAYVSTGHLAVKV
eukprot:3941930-Rhodomonas_salina.20